MRKLRYALIAFLALAALAGCAAPATPTPAEASMPTLQASPTPVPTATPPAPTEIPLFPVTVTDGLGSEVTVSAKPMKIVSLTLGTDETLLDLVGPGRLIGVTYLASKVENSNIADRPELALVPNVVEANPEQIIALEPDLVFVASFTDADVIDQIKQAGVTVFVVGNFTSVAAMEENIITMGKLVGEPEKAQALVDGMEAKLADLAAKIGTPENKPTVLYYNPGGWVAGAATTPDDIITRAGGVNAAAALTDWQQIGPEPILEDMKPDVVILSPFVSEDEFLKSPAFATLDAVKNGKVFAITDAHMSATSQYIVLAVEDLAKLLYPDAFK